MWWELHPSSCWKNIGGSFVLEVAGKHGGRFVQCVPRVTGENDESFVPGVAENKIGWIFVPGVTGKNDETFVPGVAGNKIGGRFVPGVTGDK